MSGAAFLTIALAEKRRRDLETARATNAARKRKLKSDEKAKRRAGYARDAYSHEHSYMECVLKEMVREIKKYENGEIANEDKITLIRFLKEFEKTYNELLLEDVEPLKKELEEMKKKISVEEEKQREIREKLGDKFDTIERLGLEIDMLEDEEKPSYFRKKYDYLNQNGKENHLLQEIKRLERKLKYFPFGTKNRLLLEEKQLELKKIQRAKLQAEEFESLSTQDKKQIIEYLLSKEKSWNLHSQTMDMRYKINNFVEPRDYGGRIKIEEERCARTLGRMLNEGKISDKDLEYIFRKLDKVGIKARRGEYIDDFRMWGEDYRAEKYSNIMRWFITNVYEEDEHFLDRNTEEELKAEKNDGR